MSEQSNNKIQKFNPMANWNQMYQFASGLIKASGFLPAHFKSPEQVIAVILKGKELGIPEMEALSSLFPVNGRIGMVTPMMNALVRRSGLLEDIQISDGDGFCQVTVKRKGVETPVITKFSIDDAKQAELYPKKDNWRHYPRQCMRARALSDAFRLMFPDIIGGIYTVEELGAEVLIDEGGEETVIEIPFDEEVTYNRIMDEITNKVRKGNKEDLQTWYDINKEDISKLSIKKCEMIIREFKKNGVNMTEILHPEEKKDEPNIVAGINPASITTEKINS